MQRIDANGIRSLSARGIPLRRQIIHGSLCTNMLTCILACAFLAGCTHGDKKAEETENPDAKALPAYLCDSQITTNPLRRIYPKGAANGTVQMYRDGQGTGKIKNFMDKKLESGNSQWSCWVQFNWNKTEVSLFNVSIMALTPETPASLKKLGRQTGDHPRRLSLGIIHGANGAQRSVLKFPCRTKSQENLNIVVSTSHHIDPYAADAYRESVRRTSRDYTREITRYFVDTLHPCENLLTFPPGEFKTSPMPEATSSQSPTGGE